MVSERLDQAEILPFLVAAAGEEERETMASLGERLIEEGRVKGLEQGREEGLEQGREEKRRRERELLAKLLMGRFGPLPEAALARLNVADSAQIDRWVERVLTASSLADVLGDG